MKIMPLRSSCYAAAALLLTQTVPAVAFEGGFASAKPEFVAGEIIVKLKPTMTLQSTNLTALGIQALDRLTSGGEIIYRIQPALMGALSATAALDRTLEIVQELKGRPEVLYAQPNYILHAMKAPNDPLYAKQWHYFNNGTGAGESPGGIDLPKAWDAGTGGNVVVAVIDTGILPKHPDITGSPNLASGYDFIGDAARANDGDGRDSDPTDAGDAMQTGECGSGQPDRPYPNSWHGTHVAGTIGAGNTNNNAGVAGINWNVKVQALRVLGKCGGATSDINDAIRWAAGISVPGVPDNPSPAKVINMSLGGELPCFLSPSQQSAIDDAINKGVAVVVAAGNSGKDAANFSPAGCNNVITVAASDPQGHLALETLSDGRQYYSNWGSTIEIMAPGGKHMPGCTKPQDGVLSTVGSDTSGPCAVDGNYAFYNGTSMAAPHVAGVAALWLSRDASLTPKTLVAELQKAARPRNSTQCPKPCGAGLLSAVRAGAAPPPPPDTIAVSLSLSPDKATYQVGETATVSALVQKSGAPQAGKSVAFGSSATSIASVSPVSATTDAAGKAVATVKANAAGTAAITAQANGAKAEKTFKVQQVPDLSLYGIYALMAAVFALGALRRRADGV